jgi:membrane peptidoglycan carboxypeptidase
MHWAQKRKLRRVSRLQRIITLAVILSGVTLFLIVAGLAAATGIALVTYDQYAQQYVPPTQMALNVPSSGAVILDRNGQVLYEFVDDKAGIRKPIELDEVSPHLIAATIATEDPSFFKNPGMNFRGILRAGKESFDSLVSGGDAFAGTGGSSITQQLIKNVYIPEEDRSEKSIDRKLRELIYAAELTKTETKEQILEWYFNEINYGGIYSGVEAASQGYFGKPAKDLTLGEATLLAGIPQSPGTLDPKANLEATIDRREQVIALMQRDPTIEIGNGRVYQVNPAELEAAAQEPVNLVEQTFPIQAPHFVLSYVVPQLEQIYGHEALLHNGLVITTSLDLDLQNRALGILQNWVSTFERVSNTHNGATMVMEPRTGEILVMLGSLDYYRQDIDGEVNNAIALNSPGSTFKPFVYLTSFVELGWTPSTIIEDAPTSFREPNGTFFSPENPGGGFHGNITIRNALGNSLNIPPFKTAMEVGVDKIVAMAKRMGFTDMGDSYGPSIALGGADFKLVDLLYGYSIFANNGVMVGQDILAPEKADERMVQPVSILKVADRDGNVIFDIEKHRVAQQIVPPDKAYMIADILSDPGARCITFGCGGLEVPGYRVAVKTGTSEPYDPQGPNAGKIGETWAFGFTPDLAVGVWAGNADNAAIDHIFSTSISYRAMRDILLEAYKGRTPTNFQTPEGYNPGRNCQGAACRANIGAR